MLKAIFLALFMPIISLAREEYATISAQRWKDKLVVSIHHDEGWHTYWKNPGDAGIASTFKFSNAPAKTYEWPAPKRYIEAGDILTIGYSGLQHFFFENVPGTFDLEVGILICKDICIPGEAKLKMGPGDSFVSSRPAQAFKEGELSQAFDDLPHESNLPPGFEYYLTRTKDSPKLTLHYSLKNASSAKLPKELNFLTGFPQAPWGYKRETIFYKEGTLYGKTEIDWDGEYQDPPVALPVLGKFSTPYELKFLMNAPGEEKIKIIKLKVENFSIATSTLNDFYKDLDSVKTAESKLTTPKESIFQLLMFAFLGGLILNLMPCVLPVISLKLFGLIRHQNLDQSRLFAHNLTYTGGVILTFLALAGVVASIKAAGEEIGWGFQLQSPAFILIIMLILFVMALNLFGLFEFSTPGGSRLGATQLNDGFLSDFFSGVLTTILSTPCSAPFLGTALTFAFTTSTTNIFLIFLFIGIGLSFPFLMTAVFPASLRILPRPGAWMEKLKYFLGLSLVITIVWLYDVFVSLVDFDKVSWRLNLLFVFWFFAFFFSKKISLKFFARSVAFLLPTILTWLALVNLPLKPSSTKTTLGEDLWSPWSEDKLQQEKGKTIFMDFTAEWCLTCKVNKKLVLETNAFKDVTKKYNMLLLRADWTRRDDHITQFLKRFGAVGVPAYFIQKANGTIVSLGETISINEINQILEVSP
jgi:thiol:disulfide interchange protein